MTRRITAGFVGKTNIWLRKTSPQAYLTAVGNRDRSPTQGDRYFYNVDVAVAVQAAILVAARHHLGTCWMAAIDQSSVADFLGLGPEERVVACVPVGHPRRPGQRGWSLATMWDKMSNRLVSSRRKSFDAIHFVDSFRSSQKLPPGDLRELPPEGPDVSELVAALTPSERVTGEPLADPSLSWMIEAARHAPSADNAQIWRFVVLQDEQRIASMLSAACRGHDDLAGVQDSTPSAAVVLASASFIVSHVSREQPFFLLDVPIALLHMLLTAVHLGLSWNVIFRFNHEMVARHVDLPEKHKVVAMVLFGHNPTADPSTQPWVQLHK